MLETLAAERPFDETVQRAMISRLVAAGRRWTARAPMSACASVCRTSSEFRLTRRRPICIAACS